MTAEEKLADKPAVFRTRFDEKLFLNMEKMFLGEDTEDLSANQTVQVLSGRSSLPKVSRPRSFTSNEIDLFNAVFDWASGNYEGLVSPQSLAKRKSDGSWDKMTVDDADKLLLNRMVDYLNDVKWDDNDFKKEIHKWVAKDDALGLLYSSARKEASKSTRFSKRTTTSSVSSR